MQSTSPINGSQFCQAHKDKRPVAINAWDLEDEKSFEVDDRKVVKDHKIIDVLEKVLSDSEALSEDNSESLLY